MLKIAKIQTSSFLLNRYITWRVFSFIFISFYIFIINLRYLGKPSRKVLDFLYTAYWQAYEEELSYYHKFFYKLFGKKLIHIYDCDGQRAGFGLFRINPIYTIHLCKFGIIKQFRGKGLAKNFLLQSMAFWKSQGFKKISTYVSIKNEKAKYIYLSVGFEPVDFLETQIFMVKNL